MKEKEERYSLTLWGCLVAVLSDYGIDTSSITPKVGEHMVEDFLELLCKQGHLEKVNHETN